MSARKRHTAALDFMRLWVARERMIGSGPDWDRAMILRLLKRGWLRRTRSDPFQMRSFRLILQRRNGLESTPKGRRAVYMADRHAAPVLRRHGLNWRGPHMASILEMEARDDRKRADLSRRIRDLHPTR